MAYSDFDEGSPDPTTQTVGQAFSADRANLLALRDALIASAGYFPGWDAESQDADGTTPASTPEYPARIVFSKGSERVKLAFGYAGGLVVRIIAYYSADSGSTYDVIKGDSTNGYCDITYDDDDNWISTSWS